MLALTLRDPHQGRRGRRTCHGESVDDSQPVVLGLAWLGSMFLLLMLSMMARRLPSARRLLGRTPHTDRTRRFGRRLTVACALIAYPSKNDERLGVALRHWAVVRFDADSLRLSPEPE